MAVVSVFNIPTCLAMCYKNVTFSVRQAVAVLQKCHTQWQTGSGSVTKVSHSVSDWQWQCYKSVTLGVGLAVVVVVVALHLW